MDAVGAGRERDVDTVVDNDERAERPDCGDHRLRQREQDCVGKGLGADLEAVDAGLSEGGQDGQVVGGVDQTEDAGWNEHSSFTSFAGMTRIRFDGRSGFSSISARCYGLPCGCRKP